MNDKRTVNMIDMALKRYETPVGPLFVAQRHGRIKKCFSRDTAIRYLAFFMTTWAFEASGFQCRHPDVQAVHPLNPDLNCWQRGGVTHEYFMAHQRCVRRLRLILKHKREAQKWCDKWDAMHDRYMKERDELKATKPVGVG
ncbi:hypothetical protein ABKT77_16565 [Enterobacter cloacae]|uniref:hypothetical protein n=1 Tax=Enterobacter cloacae TaxID=550 RepID=UPI0032B012E7